MAVSTSPACGVCDHDLLLRFCLDLVTLLAARVTRWLVRSHAVSNGSHNQVDPSFRWTKYTIQRASTKTARRSQECANANYLRGCSSRLVDPAGKTYVP